MVIKKFCRGFAAGRQCDFKIVEPGEVLIIGIFGQAILQGRRKLDFEIRVNRKEALVERPVVERRKTEAIFGLGAVFAVFALRPGADMAGNEQTGVINSRDATSPIVRREDGLPEERLVLAVFRQANAVKSRRRLDEVIVCRDEFMPLQLCADAVVF